MGVILILSVVILILGVVILLLSVVILILSVVILIFKCTGATRWVIATTLTRRLRRVPLLLIESPPTSAQQSTFSTTCPHSSFVAPWAVGGTCTWAGKCSVDLKPKIS